MTKVDSRITVDALKYYVPFFQAGDEAEKILLEDHKELSPLECNQLETIMKLKELAVNKIADLSAPLITREINKIISSSHLKSQEELFDLLYYAGIDGMRRGLRRFNVEKMNKSSTNYLFQWITTYAKKELLVLEAPFGIPPSRFQKYKKISAVRKRMSEKFGRYAENEEVLEYFQKGDADILTMNGRVANKGKPSQANLNIKLDLIEEQEQFERNMLSVELLDPQDYAANMQISKEDDPPFDETAFGVFCSTYNVTKDARIVIMGELKPGEFTDKELRALEKITQKEHKRLSHQWRNLVRDKEGPFYKFLKNNEGSGFSQFDITETIENIETLNKPINNSLYGILFEDGKIVKHK